MLKRIYIDNFRCLVNFDLSVDNINLFLGPNGSGKSTVFEALRKIQAFVTGDDKVNALFEPHDLTGWQTSPIQTFELEISGNGGIYKYEVAVRHDEASTRQGAAQVAYERLWFDHQPLLIFEAGEVRLYTDDHSEGPTYPADCLRSAVGSLPERGDNTRLIWFRERMGRFIIVQINPMMMAGESGREEAQLSAKMENFVSWYRHISQNQGKAFEITNALKEVWEGFDYFNLVNAGEKNRLLKLHFSSNSNGHQKIEYRFSNLSDGDRTLIALYSLTYYARSLDVTLCIDEPENFLALPQIQPWLTLLYDLCSDGELQALLISHHPMLINYFASFAGHWFNREHHTPLRVKPVREASRDDGGVPISDLVARGWLYE